MISVPCLAAGSVGIPDDDASGRQSRCRDRHRQGLALGGRWSLRVRTSSGIGRLQDVEVRGKGSDGGKYTKYNLNLNYSQHVVVTVHDNAVIDAAAAAAADAAVVAVIVC